ncbi:hypothetical protein F7U66_00885 [Vibrio parahaemolyticus]|nr:hypothetical protein [Vibrio parahaemolyticus]
MEKTVIIKTRNKGYIRGSVDFADLVDGQPVVLDSQSQARDFIAFLSTPMFIGKSVSTPEKSLVYFEDSVCCTNDNEKLGALFQVYLAARCSFKVEPFIHISSLEETSKFEMNTVNDVSVDELELRIVNRSKYFLHKGKTVYASFGMVIEDAIDAL